MSPISFFSTPSITPTPYAGYTALSPTLNIHTLHYCKENYSERDNVKRLVNGFNPKKICETLPTSKYTAYSENKGEKIALCLDKEKNGNGGLIDDNTLIFVAIHEVSHIATKSVGHNDEFWSNFKFLLGEASKIGIYNIDFKQMHGIGTPDDLELYLTNLNR